MSGVCGCGKCRGCVWSREAGDRYDTTEDEAREQAERDEFEVGLAEFVDEDGQFHAASGDGSTP